MAKSAKKRRRELARQRWERQQARRQGVTVKRNRALVVVAAAVVALALVGGALALAGVFDGDDPVAVSDSQTPAPSSTAAPSSTEAAGGCTYRPAGTSAVPDLGMPPALAAGPAAVTTATLTLNGAPVTVELEADAAPCTVHSFAFLAGADYFDGTTCHRLTRSARLKVLQCGNPLTDGDGGPGYEFDNENTDGATYPAGTLAMANSGVNTNGSQFFLVYEDSQLKPDFTVFGRITSGLDVITAIAANGTDNGLEDGAPLEPVTLDDVTTAA